MDKITNYSAAVNPKGPQPCRPASPQQISLFDRAYNLADCRPFRFYGETMRPKWVGGEILAIRPNRTITPAAFVPGCIYVVRVAGYPAALVGRLYFPDETRQQEAAAIIIRPENREYGPITIPITQIYEISKVVAAVGFED